MLEEASRQVQLQVHKVLEVLLVHKVLQAVLLEAVLGQDPPAGAVQELEVLELPGAPTKEEGSGTT